jgi:hypothetical protein
VSQLPVEPRLGKREFPMNRGGRDLQRLGCLIIGEPSEKQQFDQITLSLVLFCQSLECVVEFNNSPVRLRPEHDRVIKRNLLELPPRFCRFLVLA